MGYHDEQEEVEVWTAIFEAVNSPGVRDAYRSRPISDTDRPDGTPEARHRTMAEPTQ